MAENVLPRARAIARHEIPSRPPIALQPGDTVVAGKRDDEWPAFVFVETAGGSGWVPARYLSAVSGHAVVVRGYDTTELPVDEGDVVEIVERDDESGWHWCRGPGGREGWVPVRCLAEAE